jgi:hypothetical protein
MGELSRLAAKLNIRYRWVRAYRHHENGLAERGIQDISEKARVALVQSGINVKFWPAAVEHATMVSNLCSQVDASGFEGASKTECPEMLFAVAGEKQTIEK